MNLNNEGFFINCSGIIPSFDFDPSGYRPYTISRKITFELNYCEYCNSQLLNQENRCSSCGAPKNSYKVGQSPKIKERNYYE
jgi:predicted amidophosphoribosyltransferase